MANMLNSPMPHSIGSVSDTMPCVKVKEETDENEPYGTTPYMSGKEFKVDDPYDQAYMTKHDIACEDFKVENAYDGAYGDCNGAARLSGRADDRQPFCSDDDSSKDSSEDGDMESEPEDAAGRSDHALPDSDSDSSSESSSSGSSSSSSSVENQAGPEDAPAAAAQLMCENCGKGPFKNIKVHLHHCSGMASPFQCSVCKKSFRNENAQQKHRARYHVCFLCSEVFVHWSLYRSHVCPKGPKPLSPTIFWSCSTSPPNKCNICKAFFATKNSLLSHMVFVHSTKVTSKVCIITNPALVTPIGSSAGGSGLVLVSSGAVPPQDLRGPPPAMNGHHFKSQGALLNGHVATVVSGPQTPPHRSRTKAPPPVQPEVKHRVNTRSRTAALAAATTRPAAARPAAARPSLASWTAAAVVSEAPPTAEHPPIVLRISKTSKARSREPKKSPRPSWRSKGAFPCRQCGAVSRQPSLAVSHRYRHRGRRLHRCQCGRSFLRRLHLLRHCVQHAEATSYICAKCGETFRGAKLLVEHLTGRSRRPPGASWTLKSRKSCIKKVPFCCECGLCFDRPSAYIWHQLQNMQTPKVHRKRLK